MSMSQHSFPSLGPGGFHRIAYTDWGDAKANHVVLCVHGLSRNSRDFDFLARALQAKCRVVSMDVVGRGDSDWLDDKSGYAFATYQRDAAALIARVTCPQPATGLDRFLRRWGFKEDNGDEAPQLDWVGTSMGGLIGLMLAAKPGSPIRRLVLNDVGPLVPWSALLRLAGHMGKGTSFPDRESGERHLREACESFGIDGDQQWQHLLRHGIAAHEDGTHRLRYDPALGQAQGMPDPELPLGINFLRGVDLWSAWEQVSCPVLVLRGKDSDVLQPDTLERMRAKRDVEVVEFPGVGHAPALMGEAQIAVVRDFLLRDAPAPAPDPAPEAFPQPGLGVLQRILRTN